MSELHNPKEWHKDTILASERGVLDYVGGLGLYLDDFDGKILDLGSGAEQRLNEEVGAILKSNPSLDLHPDIVSLSPDMTSELYRTHLQASPGYERKTVAAIGQQLPFKEDSFERVISLGGLITYVGFEKENSTDKEIVQSWLSEVVRVLKPGGEARLGMIYGEQSHQKYIDAFDALRLDAQIEIEQAVGEDGEPYYTTTLPREYVYRMIIRKSDQI